ncbi:MAG: homogentisate 1,2-dioxygenase [Alphaproteobacteria bacterium]|nr:homogentisate 1,2-dioxygenase [Alphaproteobacteria bacterium]
MARNWISLPRVEGTASRQAHVNLPAGTFEREMGREGFFGPSSHLYHRHPPTGWSDWEGPLKPRAFDTVRLAGSHHGPWEADLLLHNAHVKFRLWRQAGAMDHLVRNGDGDELIFVHQGAGELFCDFGHLAFREGDYIVLPRGTMWRIEPAQPVVALLIEATNDAYRLPDKGLLGEHAIFDPAMLDVPAMDAAFRAQQDETEWKVRIKRRDAVSTVTYPFNPLDATGWKGTLSPVRINWRDIRPVVSARYHLPPSAHTTFLANRFVVCTFCPRPFESDPEALKVPFFHNNDDFDEVLFYHQGDFFSRDNIHAGMITLHPCGFPHGPHPKALNNAFRSAKPETDEVAVMLDARDALEVGEAASRVEFEGYVRSWMGGTARPRAAE